MTEYPAKRICSTYTSFAELNVGKVARRRR
jgi:hypothetical protein